MVGLTLQAEKLALQQTAVLLQHCTPGCLVSEEHSSHWHVKLAANR